MDAEGPVTVPEGTGAGVARLPNKSAPAMSEGEARSDSAALGGVAAAEPW